MNRRSLVAAIAGLWAARKAHGQGKPKKDLTAPYGTRAGGGCIGPDGYGAPCPQSSASGGSGHIECLQCGAEFADTAAMLRHLDTVGINHSFKKPKPNQCPVCGTMAEPWVDSAGQNWGFGHAVPCEPPNDQFVCVKSDPYKPLERFVRCRRCNAVFGQDSVAK